MGAEKQRKVEKFIVRLLRLANPDHNTLSNEEIIGRIFRGAGIITKTKQTKKLVPSTNNRTQKKKRVVLPVPCCNQAYALFPDNNPMIRPFCSKCGQPIYQFIIVEFF